MKNFPVNIDGKEYWISRSIASVVYVFGIINNEVCVLANKRGSGVPTNVGKWNAPSGYLDFNETLEEAACRECFEETGVKINPNALNLMGIDSQPSRTGMQNVLVRYWTFIWDADKQKLTSEHSEPNEVDDIQWIPTYKVDNFEWTSKKHLEALKLARRLQMEDSKQDY